MHARDGDDENESSWRLPRSCCIRRDEKISNPRIRNERIEMDRMKKGISPLIGLIVILGILLLVWYFVVSYYFRSVHTEEKVLVEMPLLTEGDKVETYVRSFQNAVELSLIQGCFEAGNQGNTLWGYYDQLRVSESDFLDEIGRKTNENLRRYLEDYKNFAGQHAPEIELPEPSELSVSEVKWNNETVEIVFNKINFSTSLRDFEITRIFNPKAKIRSRLNRTFELARFLIVNDYLGKQIEVDVFFDYLFDNPTKCDPEYVEDINDMIDDVVLPSMKERVNRDWSMLHPDENVQIVRLERIEDVEISKKDSDCGVEVKVLVTIKDLNYLFLVWDGGVREENLRLNFQVVGGRRMKLR